MIIGVTNIKGGVGKTTSSLAIATAAQRSGLSVTVVDTDPQGSATLWAQAAEDADDPLPFPVVSKNQAEIRRMRERRPDRDGELIVIDTPPNGAVVDEAIKTADFVVIPTLSSPIDLQQTMLTAAQQAVQAHYALQTAQVSLYTALGGAPAGTDRQRPSAVTP